MPPPPDQSHSPVLHSLAQLYAESKAGRTGTFQRDFLVDLKILLATAGCQDGDDRERALQHLREHNGKLLHLEGPRRDPDIIHKVRFPASNETILFQLVGLPSPTESRRQLADQFARAAHSNLPLRWRDPWIQFCAEFQNAALAGAPIAPFSRTALAANAELLDLIPKLLAWHARGEESLLRFASCVLTGNSKRLGLLAAQDDAGHRSGKIGLILHRLSQGEIQSLDDLGILQAPRFALLHGPLQLSLHGQSLDLGQLHGPFRLSETDIALASTILTTAPRCLTVENETSFHELAKLNSGTLLACTSYPGSATLTLLKKLPASLDFFHFGDSDPEGFDILRDLRERSGRSFQSLHMRWRPAPNPTPLDAPNRRLLQRLLQSPLMQPELPHLQQMLDAANKGLFEQESLGLPSPTWPFYP